MLYRLLLVTGLFAVIAPAHEDDACINGTARLLDGENYYNGMVQYCKNGRWVYLTDTDIGWGESESCVVCHQLGYSQAEGAPVSYPLEDNENFVSIYCDGSETAISLCSFESNERSSQSNAISITCIPADGNLFWERVPVWRLLQLCEAVLVAIGILVWMVRLCCGCGCCDCCPCKKSKKKERN